MTLFLVLTKYLLVLPEETLRQIVVVYLCETKIGICAGSILCKINLIG